VDVLIHAVERLFFVFATDAAESRSGRVDEAKRQYLLKDRPA
jgi:hypothetical protein